MGTKTFNNYEDLLTFTRASKGHALRPVSYGTELVTNGTFDTDSDWVKTQATISGGVCEINSPSGSYAGVYQAIPVTVGKMYFISVEVVSVVAGSALVNVEGGSVGTLTTSGFITTAYVATDDTLTVEIKRGGGVTEFTIDNLSVKEVTLDESDGTLTLFEHPDNVPRVEYDADGNRLGLLVEEARTNLVTYSTPTLDDWVDYGVTASTTTFPDGTQGNGVFIPTTANAQSYITTGMSVSNATTYTKSVYVKDAGLGEVSLHLATSVYTSGAVSFNFLSETITEAGDVVDSGYEKLTNGWYRIWMSGTTDAAGADNFYIGLPDLNSSAGNGIDGVAVWGAQLEEGSFPTSYIKTTGSTATRSSEICDVPVSAFGYNASNEGTFVIHAKNIKYDPNGTDYPFLLRFDNATNSHDRLGIFLAEISGNMNAEVKRNNVGQVSSNFFTATGGTIDSIKIAFAFAEDDFAVSDDGDTVVTDTSGTLAPSKPISKVGLGQAFNSVHINGCITSFQYYPRRLTNAQIEDLSS